LANHVTEPFPKVTGNAKHHLSKAVHPPHMQEGEIGIHQLQIWQQHRAQGRACLHAELIAFETEEESGWAASTRSGHENGLSWAKACLNS
jgi:hypothetical protein